MKTEWTRLDGLMLMDLIPYIALRTGIPSYKRRLEVSWFGYSFMIYWGE